MDDLGQLTSAQTDVLKQFETAIKDLDLPYRDATYIVRWLLARDYDIEKSLQMLKTHLEWRKKSDVHLLTDDWTPHPISKAYIPLGYLGEDNSGNPTWILTLGSMDVRGVLKSVPHESMINFCAWVLEHNMRKIAKNAEKDKTKVYRLNILVDLENWKLADITSRLTLEFARDLAMMYEANYPEILGKLIIFNAPIIFNILYNFVKPFLSELTAQKIRILGSDKATWKRELELISPDLVPKKWGGNLTDPDGNKYAYKTMKMNMGGTVPPSNYLANQPAEVFEKVDEVE